MASDVREVEPHESDFRVEVGKNLIEVLTSGMYSNPLMVVREYVQNATDSIDAALELGLLKTGEERIDITLDGASRAICIEDNGTGIAVDQARKILSGIGLSHKDPLKQRGFRGIGRLGGLGYCDRLVFTTRAEGDNSVAVLTWDCAKLRKLLANPQAVDLGEAVVLTTEYSIEPAEGNPGHFFRVQMHNVKRFHRDALMNNRAVKQYLSTVAPVDFDSAVFSLSLEISQRISSFSGYRVYRMSVDGERVLRPHTDSFRLSEAREDTIKGIEFFEVAGGNGGVIARGWYANTALAASLPSHNLMRGIRVKQGNFEVGDEHFLSSFFPERRFSTWHIGEIHVSPVVRINARRDGFEHHDETERLFEYLSGLGRSLGRLCRDRSLERALEARLNQKLDRVELSLQRKCFATRVDFERHLAQSKLVVDSVRSDVRKSNIGAKFGGRLDAIQRLLDGCCDEVIFFADLIDHDALEGLTKENLLIDIFERMNDADAIQTMALGDVVKLFEPFLRSPG